MAQQGISPAAIEFARMNDWRVDAIADLRTNATLLRFFTNGTNPVAVNSIYAGSIGQLTSWFDREGVGYKWPPKTLLVEPEQNFANHPKSIGEMRADRSQMANDWSPRDALIEMLRGIDSGEITLDALVIVGRRTFEDGTIKIERRVCSPDAIVAVGLLNRAAFEIQHSNAHDD